ncbi:hypothetical protein QAD02_011689 [Eretmocerus hayati]|uniref:Uncharacterized protein n=1 Tax=Eretmocerus hayati TaxID=131215 RepID=A0ACC2NYG9_9HYME|nr:hypothetical protein QAD02_011689 [Eretmocerus hayati]
MVVVIALPLDSGKDSPEEDKNYSPEQEKLERTRRQGYLEPSRWVKFAEHFPLLQELKKLEEDYVTKHINQFVLSPSEDDEKLNLPDLPGRQTIQGLYDLTKQVPDLLKVFIDDFGERLTSSTESSARGLGARKLAN